MKPFPVFELIDNSNYFIRKLNDGKYFTGKGFAKDKAKAMSFGFDRTCNLVKKLREKGLQIIFEFENEPCN